MNPSPLTVTTPTAAYEVVVGAGVLSQLPAQLERLGLRGRIWLISDAAVYQPYAVPLEAQLRDAGYTVQTYQVPSGEPSKDLSVVSQLYDWMIGGRIERRDLVLALGGGVIGDLAGFVAATVLRGIALIQLPTTLLAMVDSSVGGKTGVNHTFGKNLIGAFHQPRLVLSDTNTLTTLPPRELCAGWAEVIKHGVIRDAGLFELLEDQRHPATGEGQVDSSTAADPSSAFRSSSLTDLIRRAVKVKIDIVNVDERETGERTLLNYGHTLGQALETATGFDKLLHGEAVAIGMDLAARIAIGMRMFTDADLVRQRRLLRAYGLPTQLPPDVSPQQLLDLTLQDKKVQGGKVRWVLPTSIGSATTRSDVPNELVRQVVEQAVGESHGV
jgi:3-dehydroquinate synthase